MGIVIELIKTVIKYSGLVSSILLSGLTIDAMRFGKKNEALTKQAMGFLVLFVVSLMIYVVV